MKLRFTLFLPLALWLSLGFITPQKALAQGGSLYFPPLTGNTWDTISPQTLGWCPAKIADLYSYLGSQGTKAFIVLKNGKIVLENYFGTFTQDSLWYWASAGKCLTALTVGIAQQEGHLSIHDTTSKYLGAGWTACTPAQEEAITIWHQLTMTSGLDDSGDPYCTLDTCLQYRADPGTRWAYHNGPYTLLDGVIENATGQNLNAYFTAKVKNKTGITGTFVKVDYNNVFISKARSMARFGLLVLNRGTWNTTPVLTDTAYFNQMVNTSQQLNKSYGYLWWLNGKASFMLPGVPLVINGPLGANTPSDAVVAMGKNGQFVNVVPSQGLVMIRMGVEPGGSLVPGFLNDSIWKRLNIVMQPCTTTSINVADAPAASLSLYPNPAQGAVWVALEGQRFSLSVLDMLGRVVLQTAEAVSQTQLPTEGLPAGIYTVQAWHNGQLLAQQKLVLQP